MNDEKRADQTESSSMDDEKKLSRRNLLKALGVTSALIATGGIVHALNVDDSDAASNNPHDKIGDLSELETSDQSNLVRAINETWRQLGEHGSQLASHSREMEAVISNMAGRAINLQHPPAPLIGAKVDGATDDTEAVRAIIRHAEQNQAKVIIPGIAVISGEIEIKKPLVIEGIGAGSGYSDRALTEYEQISGFLVKGTGQKRVRTRVNYRGSAADPPDPPLSVAINIQAENVVMRDFTVFLDFDRSDPSPTNYGADWDVGIFIGCRVHHLFENVHVLGYWREACIWVDVTRSSFMSEFKDLDGNPYSRGTVYNGTDGLTLFRVFTQGGKWGLKIQGAKPEEGREGYSTYYYDEGLGILVNDRRGNFGASDVTAVACSFYGTNHHSKHRRDDATGDYLTDPGGGAMSIDGLAGNASGVLQGMRFISCRFSTWEPFCIKLDRVNRAVFIGCHSEGGSGGLSSSGEPIELHESNYYGPISTTARTKNLVLEAFNARLRTAHIGSDDYTLLAPASSDANRLAKSLNINGDLTASNMRVRGSILAAEGQADIRGAEGQPVRLRSGNETVALFERNYAVLYARNAVRPQVDNAASLGEAARRFSDVYAAGGVITTSDRNEKTELGTIPNAVLDAWEEVNYLQYKFIDAVKEKGEKARYHVGVIAQDIESAFRKHGLNAFEYGIISFDGNRYSIRPDECLMLEAALLRRKMLRLEQQMMTIME